METNEWLIAQDNNCFHWFSMNGKVTTEWMNTWIKFAFMLRIVSFVLLYCFKRKMCAYRYFFFSCSWPTFRAFHTRAYIFLFTYTFRVYATSCQNKYLEPALYLFTKARMLIYTYICMQIKLLISNDVLYPN